MSEPVRGFLNIDKPRDLTSFDVVRRVRRAAKTRKVGHTGTLDPLATGVLPIALGDATKLVDEVMAATKRYHATVTLGIETDTYDAEGEAVATADGSTLQRDEVERALTAFRGETLQRPPAYSAVKREGVPAYRAARAGTPHELEPRPVTVYELSLLGFRVMGRTAEADIDVACGKGFYVRSLAHDIGEVLGVGGHVSALRRTAVGHFRIEDAVPLERAIALLDAGEHDTLVHAPDAVILDWTALIVGPASVGELREGRDVRPAPQDIRRAGKAGEQARAYGPDGRLIALLEGTALPGTWHPYRVFGS